LFLTVATPAAGDTWAQRLFPETVHDFGTVARAAKVEHVFEFTNKLSQDIHVAGVRRSCGCTTPDFEKEWIKPGEKGAIFARLNTRAFSGQVGSTLTVTFDRPSYTEVQLRVDAYIRRDVVFDPGVVDFGAVDEGHGGEQVIDLQYAGRPDWELVKVQSPLPCLTVAVRETARGYGRVGYQLVARLAKNAPVGAVNAEFIVETNDQRLKRVPLAVTARVTPALSLSPATLLLGSVEVGAPSRGRLVARAQPPFRITKIECEDERFQFQVSDAAKPLHFIPVTFAGGTQPGQVSTAVTVVTDLGGGKSATATVAVNVREAAVSLENR
jgi:hypothetical protein